MAHIKLGSSKSANDSINYAASEVSRTGEPRIVVSSGLNCDPDYAKDQFEATRKLHGKNDGIQAHTVIQSFSPGEVTPEQANELGRELAEKIAPGYELLIYTHADKVHIHNHIIINSVHPDTGKKYHSDKKNLYEMRHQSNLISARNGLTIPYLPDDQRIYGENARYSDPSPVRHTQGEQALVADNKNSWRMEIREAIIAERKNATDYEDFKKNLEQKHGITTNDSGKHIVFTLLSRADERDKGKARGNKLGEDFTKEGIINVIESNKAEIEKSGRINGAINNVIRGLDQTIERNREISETLNTIGGKLNGAADSIERAALSIGDAKSEHQRRERETLERAEAERQRAVQQLAENQRRIAEANQRAREPKPDIPKPTRRTDDEPQRTVKKRSHDPER